MSGGSATGASSPPMVEAWARARAHSPFLAQLGAREPALLSALLEGRLDAAPDTSADDLPARLRRERNGRMLALGLADLAGLRSVEEVTGALSAFADEAVDAALSGTFRERFGTPETAGFTVLALGKHGSRELNYSSDIDLILLYDPARLPRRGRDGAGDSALRLTRRFVELLSRRTEEGHVFRVDLRLRPAAEVTPLALPVDAAISHYESSALPWERAAFIRARAVGGDVALGEAFLQSIAPFRWRRALDFRALDEVKAVARRIREHYAERQAFGPGYDLKRGRGGIRALEFLVQSEQLVLGGRNPSLRAPAILDALHALATAGRMGREDAAALGAHYRLLRTVEHRLQMVDDQQTHRLPTSEALDGVARLHGLPDGAALLAHLRPAVEEVAARFEAAFPDREGRARVLVPAALGEDAERTVRRWREGVPRGLRAPAARDALENMLPVLLEALRTSADAPAALARFDRLFDGMPGGVDLLSLLAARPAVTEILAEVVAHSPTLAEQVTRRPGLLDVLLDRDALALPGSTDALAAEFRDERLELEGQMDRVRRLVGERRFALGVALVLGREDPLAIGRAYARVAEAALRVLAEATTRAFEEMHGRVPGGELGAIALGRLGGGLLTHASDLDLVFVWTGPTDASSDGARPLRATDYHNRLARRLVAAFSLPTAAGPLYEVDTRLRPQGADGMLAVSAEGFARYQAEDAWTWERMALTRARPVVGSEQARERLNAAVAAGLAPGRSAQVKADAVAMRRDLARSKPPAGPLDVKLGAGGLVDLEFGVQALQLGEGLARTPDLGEAVRRLLAAGCAPPELAGAHDLLTRMLVCLRLLAPGGDVPPPAAAARVARACGLPDWAALEEAHGAARAAVDAFTHSIWGEDWWSRSDNKRRT